MNLILFSEQADRYTLDPGDPRFDHVRGVLRARPGDRFMVGVVNGPRGDATVTELHERSLEIAVTWDAEPMRPPPPMHLLLAIPRPATARKVLFDATTLGVRHFHFFQAEKSDPAYARSGLWTSDEWRRQVWLGAEQAFSTHLPKLDLADDLTSALETLPSGGTRLALDVYEGARSLAGAPVSTLPAILALGGERGWSARERDLLRGAGFTLCSLGQRVLRVETAATAALALILAQLPGGWSQS